MNYLHYQFNVDKDDVITVSLDKAANVRLLDATNYLNYKQGRQHKYYGGFAKTSPVRLSPPHPGVWHVVIDLGGYSGVVRASAELVARSRV